MASGIRSPSRSVTRRSDGSPSSHGPSVSTRKSSSTTEGRESHVLVVVCDAQRGSQKLNSSGHDCHQIFSTGGVMNFAQMGVQSIDQGTLVNFLGNIGKTLLSLVVIFYDLIFILQCYILYPLKMEKFPVISKETVTPLLKSSDIEEESSNV
ncbi:hypothetical protein QJS10_CPB04g01688 [Acorus calamus]|uniref:Uncharacterized protein n=1 Tax=Acorus calamus TaxID=4465 RepID=A0AAV9EZQ8_ACOCL|nr:hypothetical protein QJS10_CPB04g01688 [Acorus calamus]